MKTVRFLGHDCVVEKTRYPNGRPALVLNDARDGEMFAVATVNLPDLPAGPNQVFIKDYSENEGMLAALEAAGIVRPLNVRARSEFVSVPICELLPPYQEQTLAEVLASTPGDNERETPKKDRGIER
jgi:hypothetical protein